MRAEAEQFSCNILKMRMTLILNILIDSILTPGGGGLSSSS